MTGGYKQFCPVAMASEILGARWTLVLLRELVVGPARFNELRRGVPRMSPALLSKRLKDLEKAGIVSRTKVAREPDAYEYALTASGEELRPIIEAIGLWGHRWIETEASLKNLDPNLLMWDMRRNIDPNPMPARRTTIQVILSDLEAAQKNWWLIVAPGCEVDLCSVDPGFDVDLYVSATLRTMTEVWMGYVPLARAKEEGKLLVTGEKRLEADLGSWLRLSSFAKAQRMVA
jgi:DNA-binding HxlR family transcriptional regulator